MTVATGGPEPAAAGALVAEGIRVEFGGERGRRLVAVDGVDLVLPAGGALGLVGESGCGKTTLARAIVGLQPLTAGAVRLGDELLPSRRSSVQRRAVQMVFQDPTSSLNPRLRVGAMLRELLAVHFDRRGDDAEQRVRELLDLVGLPAATASRYPRELSGGQRQRVSIARALAVEPQVLVADEPTSALDVSVQATILQLFVRLRAELDLSLIFISHNVAAVRAACDDVAVMYLGRIVESGGREAVLTQPAHPYTRALLASVPRLGRRAEGEATAGSPRTVGLSGELPSPLHVPAACRLHPRCPRVEDVCRRLDPPLAEVGQAPDHRAACHFRNELAEGAA